MGILGVLGDILGLGSGTGGTSKEIKGYIDPQFRTPTASNYTLPNPNQNLVNWAQGSYNRPAPQMSTSDPMRQWYLQQLTQPGGMAAVGSPRIGMPTSYAPQQQSLINSLMARMPITEDPTMVANQQEAIQELMGIARGNLSPAAEELKRLSAQNIKQQMAFAASAPPQMSALAARLASQNMGNISQGLAGQTAQAQVQERMQAWNVLSDALQQARQLNIERSKSDITNRLQGLGMAGELVGQERGLETDVAKSNLASRLQMNQLLADMANNMRTGDINIGQNNLQARLAMQALNDESTRAYWDKVLQEQMARQAGTSAYEDARTARYLAPFGTNLYQRTPPEALAQSAAGGLGAILLNAMF